MKKILVVILLIIFFSTYDVLGKEIIIDNNKFDDTKDIYGNGYYFDSDSKILYLNGYNGGLIVYDDLLEIRIKNINIINGLGNDAISCNEVSIYGDGVLNIYNANNGIYCERLQAQITKVYLLKCNVGINVIGIEIYLDQMNLVIEECDVGINSSDNIFLGYSNVNIINCDLGIMNDLIKTLALYNSKLYIKTNDYCLFNIQIIDISESEIVLESNGMALNEKNIMESDMNMIYVSDDKINYFIDENYYFYPIIKIAKKEKINELLVSDEGLIIEVDKNFLENKDGFDEYEENNKNNEVIQGDQNNKNEELDNNFEDSEIFTENEYTESEHPAIEITNPNTVDDIYIFITMAFISFFICTMVYFNRRKNG